MYITMESGSGIIGRESRYAKQCAVALARPVDVTDPIGSPEKMFAGKIFLAFVGYRRSEKPRGGRYSDDYALKRKDELDYLRVHDLLQLEEL